MLSLDLDDAIAALSPTDRALAEFKALAGDAITKGAFVDFVRAVAASAPDGRLWTAPKVKESTDRLIRKRVLDASGAITPAWRRPLLLQLIRRADGAEILAAARKAAPKSWREQEVYRHWQAPPPHLDVNLACSVRLAALANDGETVERLIALAGDS